MNSIDFVLVRLFSDELLPPPISTLQESVYHAGFRYRDHVYADEVEILYVLHGASYVGIDQKEFIRIKKNDCLVIFPRVRHNFFLKENENCRIIDLVFRPGDLSIFNPYDLRYAMRFLYEILVPRMKYLRFVDNGEVREVLERILKRGRHLDHQVDPLIKVHFCELYLLLSGVIIATHDDLGKPKNQYVTTGLEYLNNFYNSHSGIESVAQHVGISARHFARLFIQEMGMSVQDYLTILRIRKAKDLLENSDMDITGIAYSLGFNSSQYFTTCFKRIEHLTPKEYRRIAKSNSGFGPLEAPGD